MGNNLSHQEIISKVSHQEIVTKGGKACLAKHGREHYVEMGRRSAEVSAKKRGLNYFKKLSDAGVAARRVKREERMLIA